MPASLDYGLRRFQPPMIGCGTIIYAIGHHRRKGVAPGGVALSCATYGLLAATTRPGWIVIHGQRYLLRVGEVALLFPGQRYRYGPQAKTRCWPHAAVLWNGAVPRGLQREGIIDPRRPLWRLHDPLVLDRIFAELAPPAVDQLGPRILALLEQVHAGTPMITRPQPGPHRVDALIAAIAEDPLATWNFAAEARDLGLSPVHLRRVFRERCGDPPTRYLARQRMHVAATRLLAGETAVSAAASIGMEDPAYFSRRFTQLMGSSPSRWLCLHLTDLGSEAAG